MYAWYELCLCSVLFKWCCKGRKNRSILVVFILRSGHSNLLFIQEELKSWMEAPTRPLSVAHAPRINNACQKGEPGVEEEQREIKQNNQRVQRAMRSIEEVAASRFGAGFCRRQNDLGSPRTTASSLSSAAYIWISYNGASMVYVLTVDQGPEGASSWPTCHVVLQLDSSPTFTFMKICIYCLIFFF